MACPGRSARVSRLFHCAAWISYRHQTARSSSRASLDQFTLDFRARVTSSQPSEVVVPAAEMGSRTALQRGHPRPVRPPAGSDNGDASRFFRRRIGELVRKGAGADRKLFWSTPRSLSLLYSHQLTRDLLSKRGEPDARRGRARHRGQFRPRTG